LYLTGDQKSTLQQVCKDLDEMAVKIRFLQLCQTHLQVCFTMVMRAKSISAKGMQDVLSLSKNKNKRIKVTTLLKIASNDLLINMFQRS
jgi:hypothetical protein